MEEHKLKSLVVTLTVNSAANKEQLPERTYS